MGLINVGAKLIAQGAKAVSHSAPVAKAVATEGLEGGAKIVDKAHLSDAQHLTDQKLTMQIWQQLQAQPKPDLSQSRAMVEKLQANIAGIVKDVEAAKAEVAKGAGAAKPAAPQQGMEMLKRMQQQGAPAASQMDVKL